MTNPDSQRVVPVELLPCPFCNAEPAYFSGTNIQYGHGESSDYAGVRCSVCRVEISFCNYAGYQLTERMALAAEKWNRRAAAPAAEPETQCFHLPNTGIKMPMRRRDDGSWEIDATVVADDSAAPITAAQERVSCWRLITPVAPHAWIDGMPPTRNDAEMEAEKRLGWSVELAYSRPPAQTQGSSGSEAASAIQRAITTAETYSDGVTVAISMETAKTTIDALKAHLGVSP